MGGNSRQKKSSSSFSLMSLFKPRRAHREDAWEGDSASSKKIYPSDYDNGRYVAEPGIDKKATAFIAKFHETRVMESERHETPVMESERQMISR
ncbi:hypothetical protein BT93_L2415 [Corymbia citriodora subsp. variegata]|uniref:Uncharacterized protein n=1 Tax=Corymbia citriodora subsp. variegata TaxID=360336 RepID=A0A8T0CJZ5_CORYI|nr:hypothetical protein BT93_L2415 [Corymbia citriodora subsp. variegata]